MAAIDPSEIALAGGLRARWHAGAARSADEGEPAAGEGEAGGWELLGELEGSGLEAVRLVSAGFADGFAIGLVATRPVGASGHGEESVRALIARPEGEVEPAVRALLSTEYDADGCVRRIGIELFEGEGDYPLRIAADRLSEEAGAEARGVRMRFRAQRREGTGIYRLVAAG